MNKTLIVSTFLLFMLNACKKECQCEAVTYISNIQNNYNWTESNRISSTECEESSMNSAYLDSMNYISYVMTTIECN